MTEEIPEFETRKARRRRKEAEEAAAKEQELLTGEEDDATDVVPKESTPRGLPLWKNRNKIKRSNPSNHDNTIESSEHNDVADESDTLDDNAVGEDEESDKEESDLASTSDISMENYPPPPPPPAPRPVSAVPDDDEEGEPEQLPEPVAVYDPEDEEEIVDVPVVPTRKERRDKQKKKNKILWSIVIALVILIGAIITFFTVQENNDSEPEPPQSGSIERIIETVSVPSALGTLSADDSEDFACERYTSINLECSVSFEINNEIPRGNIVSQSPESGDFIEVGSEVSLVYSAGPETSEFPEINDESLEYAEDTLWQLGVAVEDTEYVSNSGIVENRVVGANVEPGATVENGDSVIIHLSDGTIEVPDWTGESREEAETTADDLGIDIAVSTEESEEAEGTVLGQSQSGEVSMNDVVEITVAIPFESVEIEVPDVLGLSPEDAQYDLAEAGFRNITSITVESGEVDEPTVTQVVPGVGSTGLSSERIVTVVSEPMNEEG